MHLVGDLVMYYGDRGWRGMKGEGAHVKKEVLTSRLQIELRLWHVGLS